MVTEEEREGKGACDEQIYTILYKIYNQEGPTVLHRELYSVSSSAQFSSVTQSCPTLCNPMNCSTPGLPVHHHLPEFTQTHAH